MSIDIADVRIILLFQVPKTLEYTARSIMAQK
jgi:hypothetical protein